MMKNQATHLAMTQSDINEAGKEEANITPMLLVATMIGISQPQSLKLFGDIKGTKVTVLIDSGIIHNFIDPRVAKNLNIFIYPTVNFQVLIPWNKTTPFNEKFHKVDIPIKDYTLRLPMYFMEIKAVDIILGTQWLETLGTKNIKLTRTIYKFL